MSFKNKGLKEINNPINFDYSTITPRIATSGYSQVVQGSEVPYMPSVADSSLYGVHPYWNTPWYGTGFATQTSSLPHPDFNKQMVIEQERLEISDLLIQYLNLQLLDFYHDYSGKYLSTIGTDIQVYLDVILHNLQKDINLVAKAGGLTFSYPSNVGKAGSPPVPSLDMVWVESWVTPDTIEGLRKLITMHKTSSEAPLHSSISRLPHLSPSVDLVKEALRDKLDLKLKIERHGSDCVIVSAQILYDGEVMAEDSDQVFI